MNKVFYNKRVFSLIITYAICSITWIYCSNFLPLSQKGVNIYSNAIYDVILVIFSGTFLYIFIRQTARVTEELITIEANFEAVFNSNLEMNLLIDKDLKVRAFNSYFKDKLMEFSGLEAKIGEPFYSYVFAEKLEDTLERAKRVFAGESFNLVRHIHTGNNSLYVEGSYRPVVEKNGKINYIILSVIDITDKQLAQLAVAQNKAKFEAIYNNSFDAIFLTERESMVIVDCNDTSLKLFEAESKDQIIGQKGIRFHVDNWDDTYVEEMRRNLKLDNNLQIEIEYKTFKGNVFWGLFAANRVLIDQVDYTLVRVSDITPRKKIEEKLRQSEGKLRTIIDNTLETSVLMDKHMNVLIADTQMSNASGNVFGFALKEGINFYELIPPSERDNFSKNFNRALNGEMVRLVKKLIIKDVCVWLDVIYAPVKYGEEEPNVLFSFIDITDLKQAEQKLRESEAKFRNLADTSPVMIWTADATGDITFYNKAWLDFRGRSFEEEIGKGWIDGVHPDDMQWFVHQTYFDAFNRMGGYSAEYRLKQKSGEYRWIFEHGSPKFNAEWQFEGLVGSAIDITERKISELKLIEDEHFMSRVNELAPYLIYIFDLTTNSYIYVNVENIENIRLSAKDIIGYGQQIFKKYIHPDDWSKFIYEPGYIQLIEQKGIAEIDFRLYNYKDELRWIQTRDIIFARDSHGKPTQILGSSKDITAKKRAEEVLLEEKKFTERITNISPDFIYLFDTNLLKNKYQNRLITESLGYSIEDIPEITAEIIFRLAHPDDVQKLRDNILKYSRIDDNEVLETELRMATSKGEWKWILFKEIVFARDESGRPTEILGNARDITERKTAEQKLVEEQKFSSQITETSPHVIYIFDVIQQTVVYVNNQIIDYSGYQPEELMASGGMELFMKIIHEDDVPIILKNLEDFVRLADHECIESEFRIRHRNGEIRWTNIKILVFTRDANGFPYQMLGNSVDITARKLAEQRLLDEQKLNMRITRSTPCVIYIYDLVHRTVIYTNRALNDDGYSPDEIKEFGTALVEAVVHPDDLGIVSNNYIEHLALKDNEVQESEYRIRTKSGIWCWINVRCTVFNRNNDGVPTHILGNVLDVTERKLAAEELINTNKELKIANEELDGFVYRASHDLRAPLTSVMGLINILKHEIKDATANSYIDLMRKSIEKLLNVIEDLINHSKNTRMEMAYAKVDLQNLVKDAINELKYLENADKIDFNVTVVHQREFYSDKLRLVLLINNMISNAIKYHLIYKEKPYIHVYIDINDARAIITIADNGSGIEEKYQEKIFDMFFRASRDSTGSGLGLYIVKSIIEKLKGKISVDTVYGEGTTFVIEIPNMLPNR